MPKCKEPTPEIRHALIDMVSMIRMGIFKKDNQEITAKKLDKLKVPFFIQNAVAYKSETTDKYGNTVVDEAYKEHCKFLKRRK